MDHPGGLQLSARRSSISKVVDIRLAGTRWRRGGSPEPSPRDSGECGGEPADRASSPLRGKARQLPSAIGRSVPTLSPVAKARRAGWATILPGPQGPGTRATSAPWRNAAEDDQRHGRFQVHLPKGNEGHDQGVDPGEGALGGLERWTRLPCRTSRITKSGPASAAPVTLERTHFVPSVTPTGMVFRVASRAEEMISPNRFRSRIPDRPRRSGPGPPTRRGPTPPAAACPQESEVSSGCRCGTGVPLHDRRGTGPATGDY